MAPAREAIVAPGAPKPGGHYSPAIRSGEFLFLAGQTPLDPETRTLVSEKVGEQTRQCLRNLQAICDAAGAKLEDAVRCAVYVTDMGSFQEINDAYAEFFETTPPARSTIGVAALPVGAQVEIDAIVAID